MSSKTSVLEPLRVRVRRFQFIMGLGFIALIAGSILSVSLTLRLSVRIQAVPVGVLRVALAVLLENLWVLGVLPLLCYGAARVMELRPWTTAGGAALTGAAFLNAMAFIQSGVRGLWAGDIGSLFSMVAFAGGVVLSARAVMLGREAAAQQSVKSQAKAQERKSEYDEFLRAAEQGAARLEQREAQSTVPAGALPVAPAASEVAQAPVGEAPANAEATQAQPTGASESAEAATKDEQQQQPSSAEALSSAAQAQPAVTESASASPESANASASDTEVGKAPAA
ncbi:hypothetical protein ACLEPN_06075 [Myxococcus sp. 1LA]